MSVPSSSETHTVELSIGGMTCASCAARVEKKLNKLEGVSATVNFTTEKAKVSFPDSLPPEALVAVVAATGYTATLPVPAARAGDRTAQVVDSDQAQTATLRRRLLVCTALAAIGAPIHKLFNVAGVPQTHAPERVFTVNFLGLRDITERVLDLMPDGGAIANVASLAGMGWAEHVTAIGELLDTPDVAAGQAWAATHLAEFGDPYFFSKECVIVYTFRLAPRLVRERAIRVGSRLGSFAAG